MSTPDFPRLYRETVPSVVSLYAPTDDSGRPAGAGSGFVYDAAHVVTNAHVVGSAVDVDVRFADGAWRVGRVVGRDRYTDLAVLAVDDLPASATPLPVARTPPVPGEPVAALGNPLGLDGTITTGVVSGVNRSMRTGESYTIPDTVQTDAAINPGNSGGPLMTLAGEVVGVNRATAGENVGFAVSAALVDRVVPALIADGHVRHASLRVRTLDVSPTVADANGLPAPRGVLVVDVRDGPATGLLRGSPVVQRLDGVDVPVGGDVVVGVDGTAVRSHEELTRYLLTDARPGHPVTLDVLRDGDDLQVDVVPVDRPPADGESRVSLG